MYENAMTEKQRDYYAANSVQNTRLTQQGIAIDSPQSATPMNGATAELQMSLDVLSKVAEELRHRLSPVLRAMGPENAQKDGSVRAIGSPLRDQLDNCTQRVGGIRNTLSEILDRLEV